MSQVDHRKVFGAGFHAGLRAAETEERDRLPDSTQVMLSWEGGSGGKVKLVSWPDPQDRAFLYTALACDCAQHQMSPRDRQLSVLRWALLLVVHFDCSPTAVHRALLGLREYHELGMANP